MASPMQTPDSTVPQSDTAQGDLFATPGGATPPPNFSKLKKAELLAYLARPEFNHSSETMAEFALKKKDELVAALKVLCPDPDALDTPEVTGYDASDPIHQAVARAQALDTEEQAVASIRALQDDAEFNFFKIGGYLAEMQTRGWMGGYDNFYSFAESMFGFRVRKTQILIQIYHALVSCGVSWAQVKDVGWAKLMVLAPILTTENAADWLAKAGPGTTFAQLKSEVKGQNAINEAGGSDVGAGAGEGEASPSSTAVKIFKVKIHEDQEEVIRAALDKAKEQSGKEHDGTALEFVCLDFLSGMAPPISEEPTAAPIATMTKGQQTAVVALTPETLAETFEQIKKADEDAGWQTVLLAFTECWPDIDIEVYPDGKQADEE